MSPDYESPDLSHILIDRLGSAVSLKQLCPLRRFERKRRRRKKRGFKRERQFQNPAASFGKRSIMSQNLWSKSIDRFLQQMSGVLLRNVQYNQTSHPRFQPRRLTERPLCFCPLRGSTFRALAREAGFLLIWCLFPSTSHLKGLRVLLRGTRGSLFLHIQCGLGGKFVHSIFALESLKYRFK